MNWKGSWLYELIKYNGIVDILQFWAEKILMNCEDAHISKARQSI